MKKRLVPGLSLTLLLLFVPIFYFCRPFRLLLLHRQPYLTPMRASPNLLWALCDGEIGYRSTVQRVITGVLRRKINSFLISSSQIRGEIIV